MILQQEVGYLFKDSSGFIGLTNNSLCESREVPLLDLQIHGYHAWQVPDSKSVYSFQLLLQLFT